MLFNSIDFAIFLPIVFILYWFITNRNLRLQNLLIVISSFIFYGWWDWRFLILMVGSASVDFFVGMFLQNQENIKKRRVLLLCSIFVNLGILAFFKYFNFFIQNFTTAFTFLNYHFSTFSLKIVLPVGISFYTFQALSYTIDVYRKKLEPTRNIVDYFAFISFFPQLVAGPIERATNLLPQFYKKRNFDYCQAVDGMRQILWGLFKKIVIADNCAIHANAIFNNSTDYSGGVLLLGVIFFAFQIYSDFSGYSDIAIGTARLLGFNLMRNFAYPYFSRDIAEFWRRWHISLSTWFRDYLYIPLGGSNGSTLFKIRNTIIIFAISGFWHGANWTFIAWGLLNAIYFLPLLLFGRNRTNVEIVAKGRTLPRIKDVINICITFCLTLFAWIFFRANNIEHAYHYIAHIFHGLILHPGALLLLSLWKPYLSLISLLAIFIIIEWMGREQQYAIANIGMKWYKPIRWSVYLIMAFTIFYFAGKEQQFIYFQF